MKKLILPKAVPDEVEEITLKEMYKRNLNSSESIIAYVTHSGTGLAVLTDNDSGDYGFRYHRDLVHGRRKSFKYEATTMREAVEKAISAGRDVYLFQTFNEFVKFAVDKTKL